MSVLAAIPVEYQAATSAWALHLPGGRGFLTVTGPDRGSWLQGMVTNDVEALPVGGACLATVLNTKGAMVGLLRVVKLADALVLEVFDGRLAPVQEFMGRYLISEDAELLEAPGFATLCLVGPRAEEAVARVPAGLFQASGPSAFGPGRDLLVQAPQVEAVLAALGEAPRLSAETFEVLRVEATFPRYGADVGETTIPLEANLARAIHYQKGCYIGQEVIARATYRGQMNKQLVQLAPASDGLAVGAELRVGDRKVGWVTSLVRSGRTGGLLALGYLHRDFLAAGTVVEGPGGIPVALVAPPA